MADYDRRLQRLEELAATSADDHDDILLEACRKRHTDLMASPEMLAYLRGNPGSEMSDEEWAGKWAAIRSTIQAAVEAKANGELPAPIDAVEKIIAPRHNCVHVIMLNDGQTEDEARAAYAERRGIAAAEIGSAVYLSYVDFRL